MLDTKVKIKLILEEINTVLKTVNQEQIDKFLLKLIDSRINSKIVGVGAGRVGMALKSFIMRLGHMGFQTWFIGDTTVPAIAKGDILIVASGSGETKTIVELVKIAHKNECLILCVTGGWQSTIARHADHIIELKAPSATKEINYNLSEQPMTTLNEQCLSILFDSLTLNLMDLLQENHNSMWNRHSNLE